uniref:Uncharacterized protein n=1 Tax=Rhizophora mucronata TaxID=61149 RepID=A0A2P2PCM4_RHIMU
MLVFLFVSHADIYWSISLWSVLACSFPTIYPIYWHFLQLNLFL